MRNGSAIIENSIEPPQKIKNKITIWSNNPTSGYICKIIQNKISKINLHTLVHSRIIHNSQEVEAKKMFLHRWTERQKMKHYTALIKEGNPVKLATT